MGIEEREVLSQPIIYEEEIVLDHSQNVITFEFAALQYPFSDNCEYAIYLDNFDKGWREVCGQRNATYTNLSPGDYQFRVRARNKGAAWSDEFTSIDITILKPFWATSHIPVIILTARTSLVYKKEGNETGGNEYITKPFNEDVLLVRITGLLRNREILREKSRLENTITPKKLPINTPGRSSSRSL